MILLGAAVVVLAYVIWVVRDGGADAPAGGDPSVSLSVPESTSSPEEAPSEPAPASSDDAVGVASFAESVRDASSILVVGDSTGDEVGEWVDLLARELADSHRVRLRLWDTQAQAFAAPIVYGSGRPLDVWNLSHPGIELTQPSELDAVPTRPDVALVSYGKDRTPRMVRRAFRATTAAIADRWNDVAVAWLLQNPATGVTAGAQEDAIAAARATATAQGVPAIDVYGAFATSPPLQPLLVDGVRPSADGSRLWARTVAEALSLPRSAAD